MRRGLLVVGVLSVGLLLLPGCGDDGTALPASRSTTTAASAPDRCSIAPGPIPGSPGTTPPRANVECDERAGWRFYFWIGESGDPIYRVQRYGGAEWADVDYDVACDLTTELLRSKGVPVTLATAWGDKYSGQCG